MEAEELRSRATLLRPEKGAPGAGGSWVVLSSSSGEERSTSGEGERAVRSRERIGSVSSAAEAEEREGEMTRALRGGSMVSGIGWRGRVVRKKYRRRGWTGERSLASGQGEMVGQDRLR